MTVQFFATATLLIAILSASCFGDARSDFSTAYNSYQINIDNGEWASALESAEKAYDLGVSLFGKRSINTGNLAYNYGELLNRFNRFDEARPLLQSARKNLQSYHGKNRVELVDVHYELGKASYNEKKPKRGLKYFDRAIELNAGQSTMARATLNMMVGVFINSMLGDAELYFEKAHGGYLSAAGNSDARTALAAINLGRYALDKKEFKKARDYLQASVDVFETSPANQRLELIARTFLIEALEELGQSDDATQHCRIIGSETPLDLNTDYLPVYRKAPVYPQSAYRNGESGSVTVRFTVDENGFIQNPRVLESTSEVFEAASVAAVKGFRYAPRFEDGVAVATTDVQTQLTFTLEGQSLPRRSFDTNSSRNAIFITL